jgi:hypothetical protein
MLRRSAGRPSSCASTSLNRHGLSRRRAARARARAFERHFDAPALRGTSSNWAIAAGLLTVEIDALYLARDELPPRLRSFQAD